MSNIGYDLKPLLSVGNICQCKCFGGGSFPNEYTLCLRMAVKSQFSSIILCNLSKATLVPGDGKCLKFERHWLL